MQSRRTARFKSLLEELPGGGKAAVPADADEILPEYDFSRVAPNKYASRYADESAVMVLEPRGSRRVPKPRRSQ
jgi:hypothetical protein